MEHSKDQIIQQLTESNLPNNSNNLKPVGWLQKCFTCLECRASKNSTTALIYHVRTRHPEKSVQLLAKECLQCDLKF